MFAVAIPLVWIGYKLLCCLEPKWPLYEENCVFRFVLSMCEETIRDIEISRYRNKWNGKLSWKSTSAFIPMTSILAVPLFWGPKTWTNREQIGFSTFKWWNTDLHVRNKPQEIASPSAIAVPLVVRNVMMQGNTVIQNDRTAVDSPRYCKPALAASKRNTRCRRMCVRAQGPDVIAVNWLGVVYQCWSHAINRFYSSLVVNATTVKLTNEMLNIAVMADHRHGSFGSGLSASRDWRIDAHTSAYHCCLHYLQNAQRYFIQYYKLCIKVNVNKE